MQTQVQIKIQVKEQLLEKGIESFCIEKNYLISNEITEDVVLITDKEEEHSRQVVIYYDYLDAIFSQKSVKILRDITLGELSIAITKANNLENYTQKTIDNITKNFYKLNTDIKRLSERQSLLIKYICAELSNKEIGKKMYLSEKTIKNNITELYKIVGVKNRNELIKKCKIILTQGI